MFFQALLDMPVQLLNNHIDTFDDRIKLFLKSF